MLVLVRHGETAANAAHLLQGRMDPPLTERGRRQAQALSAVGRTAALVVCSPLRRARETAAAIQAGDGAQGEGTVVEASIEVDERWIEIDYGELDGRPVDGSWQPLWERWRADPEFTPPGGESLASVGRRVSAACQELAEQAASADVVVVTHVSPIKAAVTWALGVGDEAAWRMFCDIASVTRIDMADRGPVLRSFNEVHHLAGVR
ncbi:MAG: histidine phosphatase family protein [Acidimicrobiales bacterium]